jgi:hypothetical protein
MKIAVCISGQPRAYAQGYEYMKRNLLDHYDCDIFIHTWINNVYPVDDVIKLYNPKSWINEKPYPDWAKKIYDETYTNTPDAKGWPPNATVSMFYSMFRSLQKKTEYELMNEKYDWVVKTRFDYAINGVIPFEQLDRNRLYIPNCRMTPMRDFGNDQFAFASNGIMTDYMSTYLYLRFYYEGGVPMIGEDMMSANLNRHGLTGENLIYVDMKNPFPPGPYNGTPHSLIRDDMELWKNS